jgi:hypothetical protein
MENKQRQAMRRENSKRRMENFQKYLCPYLANAVPRLINLEKNNNSLYNKDITRDSAARRCSSQLSFLIYLSQMIVAQRAATINSDRRPMWN